MSLGQVFSRTSGRLQAAEVAAAVAPCRHRPATARPRHGRRGRDQPSCRPPLALSLLVDEGMFMNECQILDKETNVYMIYDVFFAP